MRVAENLAGETLLDGRLGQNRSRQLAVGVGAQRIWLDRVDAVLREDADLAIAAVEAADEEPPHVRDGHAGQAVVLRARRKRRASSRP